jgi:predicted esterase
MGRFFDELRRRKVFRVAGAYLVSAWALLQVAELLVPVLGLPEWTTRLVFLLLAIGFLPALIFSWAFDVSPEGVRRETAADGAAPDDAGDAAPARTLSIAVLVAATISAGGYWFLTADARWARNEAIPQIESYSDAGRWEDAFALATEVERRLPGYAALDDIWPTIGFVTTFESTPPGAAVFRRPYGNPEADWALMGVTPLSDIKIPFGLSLVRLELEGRPTIVRMVGGETGGRFRLPVRDMPATWGAQIAPGGFVFDTPESLPEGMVRVPGEAISVDGEDIMLGDFYIGRHEVTNREFKSFVDAGGYREPRHWEHEFVRDGDVIDRAQAMAEFVDSTGRPGPRDWVAGNYPDGEDALPVSGVSWYEAAAYARFAGRELPTVHHWRRAHASGMIARQLAQSNLDSDQLEPVGENAGIGWTGTYDMIGNVREWCFNAVGDRRAIVGGGFDDPAYYVHQSISDPFVLAPMERLAGNGFRLAEYGEDQRVAERLRSPIAPRVAPEIADPVEDAVYRAYLTSFDYTRRPLDPVIEASVESLHWTRHRISFTSHRDGQRLAMYLYLPNTPATSYQAVVYWPSISTFFHDSIDQQAVHLEFLLRNGRAVAFPVLDGILERRRPTFPDWATIAGRDLVIEATKDMRRSIDYLQSRADIDENAIAYYGLSWGGRLGAIALAVEPRLKAGILNQAGLQHLAVPETSVVNYLPRVDTPVLQFNGRYDADFRFETSAKPYFDLIGTDQKKHVVEDAGHYVPRNVVIGETLNWLDKYLGPPNR